ncbi:MAG: EF-Tu/IF-2/RF-3 family GTPase, partial [Promethearchaeota archaeon]
RYNECVESISDLLKNIGFPVKKINFIPVSGLKAEGLTEPAEQLSWYKGPTLIEAIDKFEIPEKPLDKPLRIPIQDSYSIKGVGVVPVGRVESGVLKQGDKIVIMPTGFSGEIRTIEMHHEEIPQAIPGDNVGISIRGITMQDASRGDCLGHPDNPPTVIHPNGKWTGQIMLFIHTLHKLHLNLSVYLRN